MTRHAALIAICAALPLSAVARPAAVAAYKPLRLHPTLFDAAAGWTQWIHQPLLDAIEMFVQHKNSTALLELLREEVPASGKHASGVYSFQLMSDDFCKMFLEELDNYYASGLPIDRPNSMNNYGVYEDYLSACGAWRAYAAVFATFPDPVAPRHCVPQVSS